MSRKICPKHGKYPRRKGGCEACKKDRQEARAAIDTPLTDAKVTTYGNAWRGGEMVEPEDCREIERDLVEAKAENERLQRELQAAKQDSELLRKKLANAEEWIVKQQDAAKAVHAQHKQFLDSLQGDSELLDWLEKEARVNMQWGRTVFILNGFELTLYDEGWHVTKDSHSDPIIDGCTLRAAIKAAQAGRAG